MHSTLTLGAALLFTSTAFAQSQNPPVNLGYLSFSGGEEFIAWDPTKTSEVEACRTSAVIGAQSTGVITKQICSDPFTLDGEELQVLCAPDGKQTTFDPTVTGIADATGAQIKSCSQHENYIVSCDNVGTVVQWYFDCD